MNNFLIEPITFIGFSTILAGYEVGIGSAALMGGVLALVNKNIDVEPLVKDTLGHYMTSKGFDAPYVEQVSKIASIGLTCLIAATLSTFGGVVHLPLIKTFGLMVATYTFKLGLDHIIKKIDDFEEKKIQEHKKLLHEAGDLLKGTDSAIASMGKLFEPENATKRDEAAMKRWEHLLHPPGIKAGSVIQTGKPRKKTTKTMIKDGEILTVEE